MSITGEAAVEGLGSISSKPQSLGRPHPQLIPILYCLILNHVSVSQIAPVATAAAYQITLKCNGLKQQFFFFFFAHEVVVRKCLAGHLWLGGL